MKRLLIFLLLALSVSANAQKQRFFYFLNQQSGASPAPDPTPASMQFVLVPHGAGDLNVLIREPEGIESPPGGGWPVILFYGGDGADVTTTTVTGAAMSGGPTTWTLTGANSGSNRILANSVVIKDDGVEIARGLIGGQIRGADVAVGSVALTNSSSAFTFTSGTSISGSITADYVYSAELLEGAPLVFNQGDSDERAIFVAVQNDVNDTDFTIAKHFDPVVKYLYNNYTINPNQIHVTGISRGARYIMRPSGGTLGLIEYRPTFYINPADGVVATSDGGGYTASGIASVSVSAPDIGGTYTVTNSNGVGLALVQGTSDGTLTNNLIGHVTTWGAQTLTEYPYTQSYYGVGHSSTIWHTNHYYRLWRTDATGTAEWDWLDFQLRYSKDLDECATLFVAQAEKRRYGTEKDIIDYREAVRKVNELGAGALKTSLQGRLATLKTTLDGLVSWRAIIVHTNGSYPISTTGYNEISNHADSQSTGTLVDDNGTTLTGISWAVGDNPQSSNYQTEITSNRGRSSVGGFPFDVNRVGMRIGSTACPVGFTGLSSGTYTLRIYFNEGSGSYTQKEITATINGVTRTQFAQINRLIGYVEWTGLSSSDLSSYSIGRNTADIYVTAEEIIKN
jgi:hypothetical protein